MIQITPELVNINSEQVNYLIDLVFKDIEIEKRAYDEGYEPYQREGLATKHQCQDHNAKAMQQHAVIQQLYVIAQYSVETEAKFNPSAFGKAGSEVEPDLCDEKGRSL